VHLVGFIIRKVRVRVASFRADRQTGHNDKASSRYLLCERAYKCLSVIQSECVVQGRAIELQYEAPIGPPLLLRAAIDS
jgi:hypothetical protein